MYFEASTLDDILNNVFRRLLNDSSNVTASRGNTKEIVGTMLRLTNPRARLSRSDLKGTVFSAIGEFLWYMSKSNDLDFISYYISFYKKETEDNKTVYGGYGPRFFNHNGHINQVQNVIDLLKKKKSSRRAVIQIFDANDLSQYHMEIPCTCCLQLLVRDEKLNMIAYMRSNDAFKGLPHDVFVFTMMQEVIAKEIGVGLGEYIHSVGSLHLYNKDFAAAQSYLDEGFHPTNRIMPDMPEGSQFDSINKILLLEKRIRENVEFKKVEIDEYWNDIFLLLKIFSCIKKKESSSISELRKGFSNNIYDIYVEKRIQNINSTNVKN